MSAGEPTRLKDGHRSAQIYVRGLKSGEILFEEGAQGSELFVIQEGKVGVYKVTPQGVTELAQIEKGGVVGEMSLLDNLPRSATVRAIEPTRALVIDKQVFQAIMAKAPFWLTSIIRILVSRLRDADRRVDQPLYFDRVRGLITLMTLLLTTSKHEFRSRVALSYDLLISEAYYVCRLKRKETDRILKGIQKRGIIEIAEDAEFKPHICINDVEALKLYLEYLNLRYERKEFGELDMPDETVAALSNIAYVAQKSGLAGEEGVMLAMSALLEDLSDEKPGQVKRSLRELESLGLVELVPEENETVIVFRPGMLSRIKRIKEWISRFEMSVA